MNTPTAPPPVASGALRPLEALAFDNRYGRLPGAYYSRLAPTPFEAPAHLVHFNADAAALIDLDPAEAGRPALVAYLSGRRRLPGSDSLAMVYAGHQFGHYVPRLGDGRALLLGQVRNRQGELWDLHLKGGGQTPYSRDGDGRAVLRSTVREYLCSEAMHGLGIPTTRALCLVGSPEEVYRERIESGATLLRLSPSHVRFGSFEYFYYREELHRLEPLADYVIAEHYPELLGHPDRYTELFRQVMQRTAELMARWQAVGFAHGVMNTDNMSILGLTLDYGPYGFMDAYDPGFVCNHSDRWGRYAFERQPEIGLWNLSCLGQALLPVMAADPEVAADKARAILDEYRPRYDAAYLALMRQKLGLREAREGDTGLIEDLMTLMAANRVDYTILFRSLAELDTAPSPGRTGPRDQFLNREAFDAWASDYRARLAAEGSVDGERRTAMNRVNPRYVLRNYLAQIAIDQAERGEYGEIDRLMRLLQRPFEDQPRMEAYAGYPPDWASGIAVSCSS
jgi:uncharacterized protein YdiU (UPF0061 family)